MGRSKSKEEKPMAICPICKSEVPVLDKLGHADGFDCPKEGRFKVSEIVLFDARIYEEAGCGLGGGPQKSEGS
jgi:hypothetical protein